MDLSKANSPLASLAKYLFKFFSDNGASCGKACASQLPAYISPFNLLENSSLPSILEDF